MHVYIYIYIYILLFFLCVVASKSPEQRGCDGTLNHQLIKMEHPGTLKSATRSGPVMRGCHTSDKISTWSNAVKTTSNHGCPQIKDHAMQCLRIGVTTATCVERVSLLGSQPWKMQGRAHRPKNDAPHRCNFAWKTFAWMHTEIVQHLHSLK